MKKVLEEMKRVLILPVIRRRISDERGEDKDPRNRQDHLFHSPLLLEWLALASGPIMACSEFKPHGLLTDVTPWGGVLAAPSGNLVSDHPAEKPFKL
jgi:hypothetical protein